MKKSTLWLVAILWLATVLAGCNFNSWDVEYDLSTEMGRQLNCLDKFWKEIKADSYWAEMHPEFSNGFSTIVEWIVKVNDDEYHLVCTYSDDIWDWTMDYTLVAHNQFDLETEDGRLAACEDRAGFYLNFNEWTFVWQDESEGWASFVRNWHVTYLKWWENAEDDVECVIDMVDKSVNVEFSNHIYNGELQENRTVSDEQPVAKMRVLEWQTEEETMAMVEETCWNMWGEWADWLCNLEDWSQIAF